jgi:hypothetical protein
MKTIFRTVIISALLAVTMTIANAGTKYEFTVTCQNRIFVVEWKTGDIDPGKEYLRVVTGTKNPSCSITDYNEARDKDLSKEEYSHEGGVINGIPFIGSILCKIFGCL